MGSSRIQWPTIFSKTSLKWRCLQYWGYLILKSDQFKILFFRFLEVVSSFAVQECYEHVKKMFDSLTEFHKLGCDILLLTQRPTTGGGGFLKLIGMPFRMLLNESESMRQILMHRQSALSMAGIRALHIVGCLNIQSELIIRYPQYWRHPYLRDVFRIR